MVPAWVSVFDGIAAMALIAAGLVGAHFGLIAPFLGFQLFVLGFLFGALGVCFGLVGIYVTPVPLRQLARRRAVLGTVLGLIVAAPILTIILRTPSYPRINDITTDFDSPPEFVHAETLGPNQGRNLKYDKARYADAQRAGYDTLAPLKLAGDPDAVFTGVRAAAAAMPNWEVTYVDEKAHRLEGVATSELFRFHDDFVIEVRPGDSGASLIEMRSKSRDGQADLGANYTRIKAFFAKLAA